MDRCEFFGARRTSPDAILLSRHLAMLTNKPDVTCIQLDLLSPQCVKELYTFDTATAIHLLAKHPRGGAKTPSARFWLLHTMRSPCFSMWQITTRSVPPLPLPSPRTRDLGAKLGRRNAMWHPLTPSYAPCHSPSCSLNTVPISCQSEEIALDKQYRISALAELEADSAQSAWKGICYEEALPDTSHPTGCVYGFPTSSEGKLPDIVDLEKKRQYTPC